MGINKTKVYIVTTEGDCEDKGPSATLGYATGDPEDIKKYFDNRKMYKLYLDEVTILEITPESIEYKEKLLNRKKDLEKKMDESTKELKGIDAIG